MEATNQEVATLVEKISGLHAAISKLPSLSPSTEVDALFTELVATCVPWSPVEVTKLSPEAQEMREDLIRLCSTAEGHLEAHYSDILAASNNPLDDLHRFPYYENYVNLSNLEHGLLASHAAAAPARVAFIGSGPLPLSSLFLTTNHLRGTRFDNYDQCGIANGRARRLVGAVANEDVRGRMVFHTADVADLGTAELGAYDVVFLAALVGVASGEKAEAIAHLGRHMAHGAALMVRSAHGARAFLYPVVELDDVRRRGFEVLAVHHPTGDEVFNSFIVARKIPHTEI
uniref:Uncharacterized protein n=1 Tax=Avena sativa TaxID=4498 RepID=A0ACD5V724_AVESA